jgi:hypothetical protein
MRKALGLGAMRRAVALANPTNRPAHVARAEHFISIYSLLKEST